MKLEDLQPNAAVRGILPDAFVMVVSIQWFGSDALQVTPAELRGKKGLRKRVVNPSR